MSSRGSVAQLEHRSVAVAACWMSLITAAMLSWHLSYSSQCILNGGLYLLCSKSDHLLEPTLLHERRGNLFMGIFSYSGLLSSKCGWRNSCFIWWWNEWITIEFQPFSFLWSVSLLILQNSEQMASNMATELTVLSEVNRRLHWSALHNQT